MKVLIFDSSSLITLTMNGLTSLLVDLKKIFQGKFIITEAVKYETIDHPGNIKRFELEALQIKKLLADNILELPESLNITGKEIKEKTKEMLARINNSFYAKEFIHLVDEGEVSCLALFSLLKEKGIESVIAIDERTTRMMIENPENLKELLKSKLHTSISLKQNLSFLGNPKFIRSAELVYVAYKKGLISIKSSNILDALLYATKFKGCSISEQEIEEIKRLG